MAKWEPRWVNMGAKRTPINRRTEKQKQAAPPKGNVEECDKMKNAKCRTCVYPRGRGLPHEQSKQFNSQTIVLHCFCHSVMFSYCVSLLCFYYVLFVFWWLMWGSPQEPLKGGKFRQRRTGGRLKHWLIIGNQFKNI